MMTQRWLKVLALLVMICACASCAPAAPGADERVNALLEAAGRRAQGREMAEALRAVSDDVMSKGYRLKIYDAYRPQKGVDHFVRWAADIDDTKMKPYFYPDLDKSVLFEQDLCRFDRAAKVGSGRVAGL